MTAASPRPMDPELVRLHEEARACAEEMKSAPGTSKLGRLRTRVRKRLSQTDFRGMTMEELEAEYRAIEAEAEAAKTEKTLRESGEHHKVIKPRQ